MKYCPYCGAELIDGAVSFCSECGEKLSAPPQTEKKSKKKSNARVSPVVKPEPEERDHEDEDLGYDGYYDDILPDDDAEVRQSLDKKLVKNIFLLGVAVIFIIGLGVLAIYFL